MAHSNEENFIIYVSDDEGEVTSDQDGICNHEINSKSNQGVNTSDLRKGLRTPEEDEKLTEHVNKHGEGNWRSVQRLSGLRRDNKSCRLRWINHLQLKLKRGRLLRQKRTKLIIYKAGWVIDGLKLLHIDAPDPVKELFGIDLVSRSSHQSLTGLMFIRELLRWLVFNV